MKLFNAIWKLFKYWGFFTSIFYLVLLLVSITILIAGIKSKFFIHIGFIDTFLFIMMFIFAAVILIALIESTDENLCTKKKYRHDD